MISSVSGHIERMKKNGALAIFANLLFDTVLVGWLAFAGLYALEALLPTFIIARLSLVKLGIILIGLTALLAGLRKSLTKVETEGEAPAAGSFVAWSAAIFFFGTIAIAHYRFPWWSIPICVGGYALLAWFLMKNREAAR